MSGPAIQAAERAFASLVAEAQRTCGHLQGPEACTVLVGMATCGRSAGAQAVLASVRERLAHHGLRAQVLEVGCLGHCYAEPMAVLRKPGSPGMVYHHLDPLIARNLVDKFFVEDDPYFDFLLGALEPNELYPTLADLPRFGREHRRLLGRAGLHDPTSIHQAILLGAYAGLLQALRLGPEAVIGALRASGLRGLGGGGFPVWQKWEACRGTSGPTRYVVCNADEGDPGAFMDRAILESDPHAVLEGLLIGGTVVGAAAGFVYVRSEYPLAIERLRQAVAAAREVGLLGADVLGTGWRFDLEIAEGAGAFVCGEETALLASVEGQRGMPRVRPPFPAHRGLYEKPTLVNNVKTLASVGRVLTEGAERFAAQGTAGSKGTSVFALAGKIVNPGLVEVPMGTTLRDLVFTIGGGIPRGKKLKAVQIGGPSGGCLPESLLDTPVDFDTLKAAGSMMGSGGMVVLDEDNCMVETARFFLEFTQQESCGKCTFCRIGTYHLLRILDRIVAGQGKPADLVELKNLAEEVRDGSLCNLGKTAANPVLTTLAFFGQEYEAHVHEQRCPARVCRELSTYYILPEKCARGCDACVGNCPVEAIRTDERRRIKIIDQTRCVRCDSCAVACPPQYDAVVRISPLSDVPPSPPPPGEGEKERP